MSKGKVGVSTHLIGSPKPQNSFMTSGASQFTWKQRRGIRRFFAARNRYRRDVREQESKCSIDELNAMMGSK